MSALIAKRLKNKRNNYHLIYKALLIKTPEGKQKLKNILLKLRDIKLIDYNFLFKNDNIITVFNLESQKHFLSIPYTDSNLLFEKLLFINNHLISELIISDDCCKLIIDNYLENKDYMPNIKFNKKIIISGGMINKRKKTLRYQVNFKRWVTTFIYDQYKDELFNAYNILQEQMNEIISTKEFKKNKKYSIEENAVKTIAKIMGKYKYLGKEVLEQAVNEYVIKSVMT